MQHYRCYDHLSEGFILFFGHCDQVEAKIVNELDRLVSVDKKGDKEYKKLFKQM